MPTPLLSPDKLFALSKIMAKIIVGTAVEKEDAAELPPPPAKKSKASKKKSVEEAPETVDTLPDTQIEEAEAEQAPKRRRIKKVVKPAEPAEPAESQIADSGEEAEVAQSTDGGESEKDKPAMVDVAVEASKTEIRALVSAPVGGLATPKGADSDDDMAGQTRRRRSCSLPSRSDRYYEDPEALNDLRSWNKRTMCGRLSDPNLTLVLAAPPTPTEESKQAPAVPPPPPEDSQQAAPAFLLEQQYKITDSDRDAVLNAASSLDVPVNVRNKLYAALNRSLQKPWVPSGALARWAEDQQNASSKFNFLREWCKDTCFGSVVVEEKHTKTSEEFKKMSIGWATKLDLELKYNSSTNETGKAYVEKLLKGQWRPHPFFPKDKEMRLYKHLQNLSEGRQDSEIHQKGYSILGEMEAKPETASALETTFGPKMLDAKDFVGFAKANAPEPKAKGKAKSKVEASSPMEPASEKTAKGAKNAAPKTVKLAALLNKLNGKEMEMNVLRTKLSTVKPNMKSILDQHLEKAEELKGNLEPAVLAGEEDAELAEEVQAFMNGKELKADVALATKTVKAG